MGPILFLLFIVVPLLELVVIIQVGQWVGAVPTVLLLLGISLAGAVLVKTEGLRAWRRFRQALAEGRVPTTEVVDGALLLVGGALLLTPGFLTDGVGLALLVPVTRTVIRRFIRGRVDVIGVRPPRGSRGTTPPSGGARRLGDDDVIDVEVVDIQREDPPENRDGT